jgi:hypothetical protein
VKGVLIALFWTEKQQHNFLDCHCNSLGLKEKPNEKGERKSFFLLFRNDFQAMRLAQLCGFVLASQTQPTQRADSNRTTQGDREGLQSKFD